MTMEIINNSKLVSIIIPVYNNSDSIEELAIRIDQTLNTISQKYEIIFINDGSIDQSFNIIKTICKSNKFAKGINLSRNFGQHPAISAGFQHAKGDYIVLMDADLQDLPEDLPKLIEKIKITNSDIVYTTKNLRIRGAFVRPLSSVYHYIFGKLVNVNVPRNIGTYRIFSKKFLINILKYKEYNVLYGPLMFYMGFNSATIDLEYTERPHGKSSYNFSKRIKLAADSIISYTDLPYKVGIIFGISILLLTVFYGTLVVLQYIFYGSSLPKGSTLILLVLCFTLGAIMLMLGIIGTYIFRVYQEVLYRPKYLINEVVNIENE